MFNNNTNSNNSKNDLDNPVSCTLLIKDEIKVKNKKCTVSSTFSKQIHKILILILKEEAERH